MLFGIYSLAILVLQSNDVTVKGSPLEAEIDSVKGIAATSVPRRGGAESKVYETVIARK